MLLLNLQKILSREHVGMTMNDCELRRVSRFKLPLIFEDMARRPCDWFTTTAHYLRLGAPSSGIKGNSSFDPPPKRSLIFSNHSSTSQWINSLMPEHIFLKHIDPFHFAYYEALLAITKEWEFFLHVPEVSQLADGYQYSHIKRHKLVPDLIVI